MKVSGYEVKKHFNVGDTVYACAYKYTRDKEQKVFHQKPIAGMLMAGKTEPKHNQRLAIGGNVIEYFVPFKKNSTELAWSKAVSVTARNYASTYTECVELYNSLIKNAIIWHINEIEKLRGDLL